METKTKTYKDAYGNWTARTTIDLNETIVLEILTMKRSSGQFMTSAKCSKREGDFLVNIPLGEGADYYKQIQSEKFRGTEKTIFAFHTKANVEEIIIEAKKHYGIE